MGVRSVASFLERRDDIEVRLNQLKSIMARDEIEVKLVSTDVEQLSYSVVLPKKDFETTLQVQIDSLTSQLNDMDTKLKKWAAEISK